MTCPSSPEMSLLCKTRWSREYCSSDGRFRRFESRFLDGTATVTLDELQSHWPRWDEPERFDFCLAFASGGKIPDREEILRYLVRNGDHYVWSMIASNVAMYLPTAEAAQTLKEWCLTAEVGRCANYFQALALTKASDALEFLRNSFSRVWSTDGLMADADFCNRVARDAVLCMKHMLELGEELGTLRPAYETLKTHPCARTREQTRRWLSEDFELGS